MADPPAVPDSPAAQGNPRPTLGSKHVLATVAIGLLAVALAILADWVIFRPEDHNVWADIVRSTVLALGLIAAVPAGYVAYRRQQTTEAEHQLEQAKECQRQADLDDANERATAKDFRDRYAAAATQIGSDKAPIRLAGVYALAQLADEWGRTEPDQRQTCIDVLCSYLRMPWPLTAPDDAAEQDKLDRKRLRDEESRVRETILRVIATHLHADRAAESGWHKNDFDFTGAELPEVKMSVIRLEGALIANKATFTGPARFDKATFTGNAWFEEATFAGSSGFDRATFSGDAWFDRAMFCRDAVFSKATFTGSTRFYSSTFSGTLGSTRQRSPGTPGSTSRHSPGTPGSTGRRSPGPGSTRRCSPGPPGSTWPRSPRAPCSTGRLSPGPSGSTRRRSPGPPRLPRQSSPGPAGSEGQGQCFPIHPFIEGAIISGSLIRTDGTEEASADQPRPFQPYVATSS